MTCACAGGGVQRTPTHGMCGPLSKGNCNHFDQSCSGSGYWASCKSLPQHTEPCSGGCTVVVGLSPNPWHSPDTGGCHASLIVAPYVQKTLSHRSIVTHELPRFALTTPGWQPCCMSPHPQRLQGPPSRHGRGGRRRRVAAGVVGPEHTGKVYKQGVHKGL